MKKVLVVYAHPTYKTSRMNRALIRAIETLEWVTISNLYQQYPDGKIDVAQEQQLLLDHDLIVLQFPFYWFNTTPMIKQWLDEVFISGFAYGVGGDKLKGKEFMLAITTGGTKERYATATGFTLPELLKPMEYTAIYCNMLYRSPFVVADYNITDQQLQETAAEYAQYLSCC